MQGLSTPHPAFHYVLGYPSPIQAREKEIHCLNRDFPDLLDYHDKNQDFGPLTPPKGGII